MADSCTTGTQPNARWPQNSLRDAGRTPALSQVAHPLIYSRATWRCVSALPDRSIWKSLEIKQ
jgi:hypothetical protein